MRCSYEVPEAIMGKRMARRCLVTLPVRQRVPPHLGISAGLGNEALDTGFSTS